VYLFLLVPAVLVVAVDQATKLWAVSALAGEDAIAVAGELIELRLAYNSGAAFSIGTGFPWLFTLATAATAVVIVGLTRRVRSRAWAMALGLILGGATTHLLDRLLREPAFGRGRVVDFIDYANLFVGNVADIALFVGVSWAVLLNLRGVRLRGPIVEPSEPPAT
jgi:signal peptidase II